MTSETSGKSRGSLWAGLIAAVLAIGFVSMPAGRSLAGRFLRSLRVQNVQAVNVDFTAFTDPNANPTLHQMVAKMISDKVDVTSSEQDQNPSDAAAAGQVAGFPVKLLNARKDAPKLVVAGEHAMNIAVDRARLQAIFTEAGHANLTVPASLEGASVSVKIPRAVELQYGTCPGPTNATDALASNITGPTPSSTQFSDCVRLREGPSPEVNLPAGLDVKNLAEIGLEVAGMNPSQAQDFLQNVDWKSTLTMPVPRFLRSYEAVKANGVSATLLTMAGRRGPGYTLVWAKDGLVYSLQGFGDSSQAVQLADSLK
jgi:hypothetical protein